MSASTLKVLVTGGMSGLGTHERGHWGADV